VEEAKKSVVTEPLGETGLKFFGAVTASISHDIKNRMAVINEQAGLLEDLVRMTEQGRELDPGRLMRIADSVKSQIAMSDAIIKTMNRFAHSVDLFRQAADLRELIALVAALAKRTAGNKGVRLEIRLPEASVNADTSPFYLMNLTWLCLSEAMRHTGKEATVVLGCEKVPDGASLSISFDRSEAGAGDMELSGVASDLAAELGARVQLNGKEKCIRILLPPDGARGNPSAATGR
jgi:signal transduction histidine kinase